MIPMYHKSMLYPSLPVRIKLTPDVKVFPVSIPLKALEQDFHCEASDPALLHYAGVGTEAREESSSTSLEHASGMPRIWLKAYM